MAEPVSGDALQNRRAEWARFNAWEAEHPAAFPDLDAAWRWYEEMWALAQELGARDSGLQVDPDKIRRIAALRARLARLPWPS